MEEETGDIVELGLLAALRLAEDTSWGDITLSAIAEEAGLPLSEFYGVTRDDLANAFDAYFDRAMSAEGPPGGESPRERLFDVIMLRFEAMEDYRAGASCPDAGPRADAAPAAAPAIASGCQRALGPRIGRAGR
jgi:hypothetical protein